jgi:deazaflavin-dependent oxidoreductase (nitroreductase family)
LASVRRRRHQTGGCGAIAAVAQIDVPPGPGDTMAEVPDHYQRPGWFTTNVFNRLVAVSTRLGVSVWGSRVLEVRGRKSGEWRQTPVNLLRHEGVDYLVSPRGHTQWVRNLRVSGQGRLRVGRRVQAFQAVELTDDEKPALLRAYLKRWKLEVGVFFGGVGPDSSDEELRGIAPDHPVFRLTQ